MQDKLHIIQQWKNEDRDKKTSGCAAANQQHSERKEKEKNVITTGEIFGRKYQNPRRKTEDNFFSNYQKMKNDRNTMCIARVCYSAR